MWIYQTAALKVAVFFKFNNYFTKYIPALSKVLVWTK